MPRALRRFLFVGVTIMAFICAHACSAPASYTESPQQHDGKFQNVVPRQSIGFLKTVAITWRFFTEKPDTTIPRTKAARG